MPRVGALPSLTIPSGQTASNALKKEHLGDAETLTIFTPAVLDAATFNVEVEPTEGGANWCKLESGGTLIVVSTALRAVVITEIAWKQLRIIASAGVAADRTFAINKMFGHA